MKNSDKTKSSGLSRREFVGASDIDGVGSENIVVLCDVDLKRASGTFKKHPDAKVYRDFRVMLEKEAKNIDAVVIGALDHIHAPAAIMAMKMGKHARLWAILAVLMALIPAYCANARELSFLQENPELKARLLRWEQEAPEEVKSEIRKLRSFCRVHWVDFPHAIPALIDNLPWYFGYRGSPSTQAKVDKAATLALIEAYDDKTAWEVVQIEGQSLARHFLKERP